MTTHPAILDIGTNCAYCRQLDFLPFTCSYCKLAFCESHRTQLSHQCPVPVPPLVQPHLKHNLPTALSLFPDRDADLKVIDEKLARATGRRLGSGPAAPALLKPHLKRARDTFLKFLTLQKARSSVPGKKLTFGSLFGRGSASGEKNKPDVASILHLRKVARGDSKIPALDRVHLWCVYIPTEKASALEEERVFSSMDVGALKKPIFVLKKWSVGRALDSFANTLSIPNDNNVTADPNQRLNIFKVSAAAEPVLAKMADRCASLFRDGELVYLVRGTI